MSEQDYPTTSKAECKRLIEEVNADVADWFEKDENEGQFINLFNKHLQSYQLIQNSSSQEELDHYCNAYDWIYPFFQAMQNKIDSSENAVFH